MFDKDYQIRGKHATYWKSLAKTPGNAVEISNNFKVFDNYLYVYMLAPIIGIMNNRKGFIDAADPNKDTAGMLAAVQIKNQSKLKYIYRLVVLLDDSATLTQDERINRAFREENNDISILEGMKTFESYFLGGLEILYETFVNSCTTDDDYINKIFEFVSGFKCEQDIDEMELDLERLLSQ
ncbi:MAG: hypothetical protein RR413_03665 [Christensenellaceae bacterium]